MGRKLQFLLSVSVLAACACSAHASVVTSTWISGSGVWSNPAKWNTNPVIPDNNATDTYIVQIDGGAAGISTATMDSSRTIDSFVIDSATFPQVHTLALAASTTLTLAGGTSTNNGAITFGSAASIAWNADSTISGTGTIGTVATSFRFNTAAGAYRLTLGSGQTVSGLNSLIGAANGGADTTPMLFTNNGTISFTGSINGINGISSLINTGTIKTTSTGTLNFYSSTIDNTGGTILAGGTTSQMIFYGSSITGGNLTSTNTGGITVRPLNNTPATLTNVNFSGILNLVSGIPSPQVLISGGTFAGTLNQGADTIGVANTITFNANLVISNLNNTFMRLTADTTLNGTGTINMPVYMFNATTPLYSIYAANGTSRLTIGSQFTLQGAGYLGYNVNTLKLTNNGLIHANISGAPLIINATSNIINAGTLKASSGGLMNLDQKTIDNTGGNIIIDGAASRISLERSTVNGGNITTTNGGVLYQTTIGTNFGGTYTYFNNVNFSGTLNVTPPSGTDHHLVMNGGTYNGTLEIGKLGCYLPVGVITENAQWNFYAGGTSTVSLGGDTTLNGTGTMTLKHATGSILYTQTGFGPSRLTIGNAFTVEGMGVIGLNAYSSSASPFYVTNNGTINANSLGGILTFQPYNTTGSGGSGGGGVLGGISTPGPLLTYNAGTMKASNGGILKIMVDIDNTNGNIVADGAGSAVQNGSFNNGTLKILNGGTFSGQTAITNSHLVIDAASSYASAPAGASFNGVENDGAFTLPGNSYTLGGVTGSGATAISTSAIVTATTLKQNTLTLHGDAAHTTAKLTISESSPTLADQPLDPAGSDAMVSVVKSLSIDNDGAGNFFASFDLKNNDLIIDYTGGSSPLSQIEAMVKSGHNGGNWTGRGITSSTAAANAALFHLAVADNALLGGTAFDSFDGIDTSNHQQVIVKFTWIADINLDGVVTSDDAIAFATFYTDGLTGAHHQFDDLNYDGVVDSNDAILFATVYNESLPHLPEPAALSILGFGAAITLLRRRPQKRL